MIRGFTLVEVVVAILVLEIGVLGVASILLAAQRTMASAEVLDGAVAAAGGVADSLSYEAAVSTGRLRVEGGEILWDAEAPDGYRVRFERGGRAEFEVAGVFRGRVP